MWYLMFNLREMILCQYSIIKIKHIINILYQYDIISKYLKL